MNARFLVVLACMCVATWSNAVLLHHYTFDGLDAYSDQVGSSDLTTMGSVGTIDVDPGGFLHFSGTDTQNDTIYLSGDALNQAFDPFVLSVWFRISTTNQSEYTSIFSSNEGTDAGFQINFRTNTFGINMNGTQLPVTPLSGVSTGEWHLVTVMQDPAADQGQVWLDDQLYATSTNSFGALNSFRLGVNRAGRQGFFGDIAEVEIYNDEVWDDTRQDTAFADGPDIIDQGVPEPAVITFIALFGSLGLIVKRIFT